jgi:hypothetical protein
VRYQNALGWSLSYPRSLYFHSVGPVGPCRGCPDEPPLTTVTLASFPKSHATTAGPDPPLGLSRNRHLPADGMVLEIQGGLTAGFIPVPDARFPIRLADFRPASWPKIWRANAGTPPPQLNHTLDADGQRYSIHVWLGRSAPAQLRRTAAKVIASIRFKPLKPGTTHDGLAVLQKASRYPVGSFTLIHIHGSACQVEGACPHGSEPLYLVHAPGHYQASRSNAQTRCIPASSCVPYGSFYTIGWLNQPGYPAACDLQVDQHAKQFYCTNMSARWDVYGRPITIPNSRDIPTVLTGDAKVSWDGTVLVGGGTPIGKSALRGLWPGLPPPR